MKEKHEGESGYKMIMKRQQKNTNIIVKIIKINIYTETCPIESFTVIIRKRLFVKLRAMTCDFQQCGILTCVDSDKSVQPPY